MTNDYSLSQYARDLFVSRREVRMKRVVGGRLRTEWGFVGQDIEASVGQCGMRIIPFEGKSLVSGG